MTVTIVTASGHQSRRSFTQAQKLVNAGRGQWVASDVVQLQGVQYPGACFDIRIGKSDGFTAVQFDRGKPIQPKVEKLRQPQRLIAMLLHMKSQRFVTVQELQERFGAYDHKQVREDLALLSTMVPVVEEEKAVPHEGPGYAATAYYLDPQWKKEMFR